MSAQVSSNVVFPSKILFLDICVKVLVWKFCLKVLGGSRKLGLNSGSGVLIYVPWNRGQFIFIPNPNQKSCDGKAKTRNHAMVKLKPEIMMVKLISEIIMEKLKPEITMEELKSEIRMKRLKSEIMMVKPKPKIMRW